MKKTMLLLTGLNLAVSGATLFVVLFGAKKAHEEIETTKAKANEAKEAFKKALDGLDL